MNQTHPAEIRIAFKEHFYNELKKILEDLSQQAEKDRFNKILCDSSGEIRSFVEQKTKLAPSGFLSDKVMDRFSDFKKRFLPTIGQSKLNKRFIMNQGSKRLYIIKDIYYYQEIFFLSKDELIKAWKLPIDSCQCKMESQMWMLFIKSIDQRQTIRQHISKGRYLNIRRGSDFKSRIEKQLQSKSKHLSFRFDYILLEQYLFHNPTASYVSNLMFNSTTRINTRQCRFL